LEAGVNKESHSGLFVLPDLVIKEILNNMPKGQQQLNVHTIEQALLANGLLVKNDGRTKRQRKSPISSDRVSGWIIDPKVIDDNTADTDEPVLKKHDDRKVSTLG
jgi:hypothetical protein